MSSRSRANSQTDGRQYGLWIEQVFSCYPIPTDLDKHVVDPTNQRQLQSRRLGFASVKFGSYFYPNITFYEIIEQYKMEEEDDLTEKAALPIKKRRYEQRRRQDIVFCMDRTIEEHISDQLRYYLFPHEAIVEALNGTHMSTFDVLVSFHLPKDSNLSVLHSACSCTTTEKQKNIVSFTSKLEEFANVCTRPKRRLTDPGLQISSFINPKSDCYAINIGLSGVNEVLFTALKQTVLDFEVRYEKMMELMKMHYQQVNAQKSVTVSNEEAQPSTSIEKNYWASDDGEEEGEEEEEEEEKSHTDETSFTSTMDIDPPPIANSNNSNNSKLNKQCSYCGSKSTPMWRRGPEGAGTLCNACGVKWKHGKILCGTEYFPPPSSSNSYKKRTSTEKKKRKYKKRVKKEEPKHEEAMKSNHKRAAATAATAAIAAGNRYCYDLDVLLDGEEQQQEKDLPITESVKNHRRRHTTDISMIQKFGLNSFDTGVDVVEAAAVLTLLKRS
ncbi:hypothetical protein RMCBS344292_15925 [Rhizopus microsporus]|nr:hypothetical protein RMCBS344292_15925 [Rhizopus microsporus]